MSFAATVEQVKACTLCVRHLPFAPRPVLQIHPNACILIVGQAPGRQVQQSGIPFDDVSGQRLRDWMGVDKALFYNPQKIAILPMGFCYPGKGPSGDLPPRPECALQWRARLLQLMPNIRLTLLIGRYAQGWHLQQRNKTTLTETVSAWREYWPAQLPLPHPSPRNNGWLKRNPWFEQQVLPVLRDAVAQIAINC